MKFAARAGPEPAAAPAVSLDVEERMFCPACGFRNPDGERFCRSCGTALPSRVVPSPATTRLAAAEPAPETASDPFAAAPPSASVNASGGERSDGDGLLRRGGEKGRRRIADVDGALVARLVDEVSASVPTSQPVATTAPSPRPGGDANATLRPGGLKLLVEQGKLLGEQYLLADPTLLIGRFDAASGVCPDIDLTAQDPAYVHRRHARLQFEESDGSLHLIDLGGRNGSFVNNQAVPRGSAVRLRVGDKVRIGRVVMRLLAAPEMNDMEG